MQRMKTPLLDLQCCDCMELMASLPPKSQHLIIADPPYFEVKGAFDFVWPNFEAYLADVEKWARAIKRVMADNGTLFWWGHAKKIAYSQVILDKYFSLENSLIWEKIECHTRKQCFPDARCFAPVTERLLMYSNEKITDGTTAEQTAENRYKYETGMARTRLYEPVIGYLIGEMERAGFDCSKVDQATGTGMATHWFARTSQWSLPTEAWYLKLRALFNGEYLRKEYEGLRKEYDYLRKEYEELRKEYEELRKEYEELRRPFSNYMKLTDVLKFSQQASITGKWNHETMKPPKLCSALIRTCSKRGQNMLVPFAGSGSECIEGYRWGLNVVASEMDPVHYAEAVERIKSETAQREFAL